jgi:hypothetical protein
MQQSGLDGLQHCFQAIIEHEQHMAEQWLEQLCGRLIWQFAQRHKKMPSVLGHLFRTEMKVENRDRIMTRKLEKMSKAAIKATGARKALWAMKMMMSNDATVQDFSN